MKVLFPARFRAWLGKWGRGLLLLLASLGFGSKSAQNANVKAIHDKNVLLDLTGQISKESSKYPVAQGSFGDVWKCTRKHHRVTVEVAVKSLRLEIPNDGCKKKIIEVWIAPRASICICSFVNARHSRGSNMTCSGTRSSNTLICYLCWE
ncbi:hypothetical protein EDB19DRAFT_1380452 [Suillus lakei]|nr:hypothetical protein EDB19DRAFT_1380452 [Suillus lakei]